MKEQHLSIKILPFFIRSTHFILSLTSSISISKRMTHTHTHLWVLSVSNASWKQLSSVFTYNQCSKQPEWTKLTTKPVYLFFTRASTSRSVLKTKKISMATRHEGTFRFQRDGWKMLILMLIRCASRIMSCWGEMCCSLTKWCIIFTCWTRKQVKKSHRHTLKVLCFDYEETERICQ